METAHQVNIVVVVIEMVVNVQNGVNQITIVIPLGNVVLVIIVTIAKIDVIGFMQSTYLSLLFFLS
jgi:hypothetical protein